MKKLIAALLAAGTLALSFVTTTVVMDSQSFATPQASVYKIVTSHGGQGSGVLIAPGLLLTAAHVVDSPEAKYYVNGQLALVLKVAKNLDVALLLVNLSCPCTPLATTFPVEGTEVVAIGYPLGLMPVATVGHVAGLMADGTMLSTAPIIFGNSGGGLFTYNWWRLRWELVGTTVNVRGASLGFFGVPVTHLVGSVPSIATLKWIHKVKHNHSYE